jgi:hypothetical protein
MVISSPCRVLVFQEMSYHHVSCRIVSRIVPVSIILSYLVALEINPIIVTQFLNMFTNAMSLACI